MLSFMFSQFFLYLYSWPQLLHSSHLISAELNSKAQQLQPVLKVQNVLRRKLHTVKEYLVVFIFT